MIIAWGFFILGVVILFLSASVIVSKQKIGKNFNKFTLFGFASTLISAQYIWG